MLDVNSPELKAALDVFAKLQNGGDNARELLEAAGDSVRQSPPARVPAETSAMGFHFTDRITEEVERARGYFPGPNRNALALAEEVGELFEAIQAGDVDAITREAVQVAAMCVRLATEGDPSLALRPGFVQLRRLDCIDRGVRFRFTPDGPDFVWNGGTGPSETLTCVAVDPETKVRRTHSHPFQSVFIRPPAPEAGGENQNTPSPC